MIHISGSAQRSFIFPAPLPLAYTFYADVGRLLNYLPHISLVRAFGPDSFRLLYHSLELGAYRIRIYADVQTTLEEGWVIRVHPLRGITPVASKAGFHSATAQGYFSSRSAFHEEGDQTRIEYSLKLQGKLPTPKGLRFMPGSMVSHIAQSITNMRIREICDGFIERSIEAYPHWVAEMGNHRFPRTAAEIRRRVHVPQ